MLLLMLSFRPHLCDAMTIIISIIIIALIARKALWYVSEHFSVYARFFVFALHLPAGPWSLKLDGGMCIVAPACSRSVCVCMCAWSTLYS